VNAVNRLDRGGNPWLMRFVPHHSLRASPSSYSAKPASTRRRSKSMLRDYPTTQGGA